MPDSRSISHVFFAPSFAPYLSTFSALLISKLLFSWLHFASVSRFFESPLKISSLYPLTVRNSTSGKYLKFEPVF
ncbi:hypothetical protein PUN28_019213 [Cardiocondyla obscurior]|uniref:Uncharacterized protein n=1 Tax=Cardiocondyla obscurior TaxID=286306 RepID=A0AAW2EG80_9HYME